MLLLLFLLLLLFFCFCFCFCCCCHLPFLLVVAIFCYHTIPCHSRFILSSCHYAIACHSGLLAHPLLAAAINPSLSFVLLVAMHRFPTILANHIAVIHYLTPHCHPLPFSIFCCHRVILCHQHSLLPFNVFHSPAISAIPVGRYVSSKVNRRYKLSTWALLQ